MARRGAALLWAAVCFGLFPAYALSAETGTKGAGSVLAVAVAGRTEVSGERILLGQVGTLSGGDPAVREQLAALDLGPAPKPGRERQLSGRTVAAVLDTVQGIRFTVPERVEIKGASQAISEDSLKALLTAHVIRQAKGDEVTVSRIQIRGAKILPPGTVSLAPLPLVEKPLKGKVSLRFSVLVDEKDCGQVIVTGWVDRFVPAVCATRFLPSGRVITDDDLCVKKVNLSKTSANILFDPALAVGKQLRFGVRSGEAVGERMLTMPPLVAKGDQVKIQAREGEVVVSVLGTAMSDGARGDQIKVENTASEKMVIGRVVDKKTVEVLF